MIVEVSVDSNGGEKKVAQAFDYATLIKNPNKTIILLWMHLDRRKTRPFELQVTLEAWLFVGNKTLSERRMGFLWREVYETNKGTPVLPTIKKSCEGFVRCLNCSWHLHSILSKASTSTSPTNSTWEVVTDNVAIENKEYVYEIFDNRLHQTWQKTDMWLKNEEDAPWLKGLDVQVYFEFKESSDDDDNDDAWEKLGRPVGHDGNVTSAVTSPSPTKKRRVSRILAYPKGCVRILKYKYLSGTHVASKLSFFATIAKRIKEIHDAGFVHGDVRNFNMLHPWKDVPTAGIQASRVIDFDLSGLPGTDCYPPGFASQLDDSYRTRCGKPMAAMQTIHDWIELGSAMGVYKVELSDEVKNRYTTLQALDECQDALDGLIGTFQEGKIVTSDPSKAISDFIAKWGDLDIELAVRSAKADWKRAMKGSGSPNKKDELQLASKQYNIRPCNP